MIARMRKAQEKNEGGFTLIELLVVIIIIGILAAIAIPTFLNQRQKGWDAAAKSELKSIATAEESYATDKNGAYTATLADLEGQGYNVSTPFADATKNLLTVDTAGTAWCAQAQHSSSTKTWGLASASGSPALGTCTNGVFTPAT